MFSKIENTPSIVMAKAKVAYMRAIYKILHNLLKIYFTTSAIDLSGFPCVGLEFEHSFRLNNSVNLMFG